MVVDRAADRAVDWSLRAYLEIWAGEDPQRRAVARAVEGIAEAGRALGALVAQGPHDKGHADVVGANLGGDAQKALDVKAHELVIHALKGGAIAAVGSEEAEEVELLNPNGLVAVATDPLDGSSNIDTNVSIGTIFSVLPMVEDGNPFLQPGSKQLAAGYVIYGPHTDIVFSVGEGVEVFTLDRASGTFFLRTDLSDIPEETNEFAVNASNYRHWSRGIRRYVDDCLAGADGPREKDFNMRWVASLVAETTRILQRGGVFLYPGDQRKGYANGRLRLVYEANPIAYLIEQAGGRATTGTTRVLDLVPTDLHQRTGLIFGAAQEVLRIEHYEADPDALGAHSPLFAYRGLFRA
ncbi:class 1 fructose-bisphosphatase [Chthonobacter albigriseus]|uniref:class 1 fructose-bisphosphatase n=1 Tax=Chthonobacter albigriseus TaxID=1683161 RepID=UPI0015EF63EB|nr:class 1 fructose-bisphosphatase [Chthonobacter albigriseus]